MAKHTLQVSLVWQIENFYMGEYAPEKYYSSPVFDLKYIQLTKWKLELSSCSNQRIGIFLCRCSDDDDEPSVISINFSLFLVGAGNCTALLTETKNSPFQKRDDYGCYLNHSVITENEEMYFTQTSFKVKCDIRVEVLHALPVVSLFVTTNNVTECFCIKWIINLFSTTTTHIPYYSYYQPTNSVVVALSTINSQSGGTVSRLVASLVSQREITVCKIYFLNRNGKRASLSPDFVLANGTMTRIRNRVDIQHIKNKNLVVDDRLSIECEMQLSTGKVQHNITDQNILAALQSSVNVSSFSKDMHRLYEEISLCDFSIHLQNGKSFKVHSLVLAARSPVLQAMIETDMKEHNNKAVNITDIDNGAMEHFIHYLYTDELKVDDLETVKNLYSAAAKYQVHGLKRMCYDILISNLSLENVCVILQLADLYQDSAMKAVVQNFIHNNRNSVILSNEWKNLWEVNSSLVHEVLTSLVLKT